MSREDEVRTTAHNVLHAAFRPKSVRDKDCSVRAFVPHREAAYADLEEKHDPAAAELSKRAFLIFKKYRKEVLTRKPQSEKDVIMRERRGKGGAVCVIFED